MTMRLTRRLAWMRWIEPQRSNRMSSMPYDARNLLFNRHWVEARAHMLDVVERFPESPNRAEALYQTGFTFFREYNHNGDQVV